LKVDDREFNSQSSFKISAEFNLPQGKSLKAELPIRFKTETEASDFLNKCLGAEFSISDLQKKTIKEITCTTIYYLNFATGGK